MMAIDMPTVFIGNVNKPADPETGYGRVDHAYRIGKFECPQAVSGISSERRDGADRRTPYETLQRGSPEASRKAPRQAASSWRNALRQ